MTEQEADQYRHFIERLKREEQRPEALNQIKNILTFKSAQSSSHVRDAGLSKIFHCLTAQDKIQLDLTCDVLKLCFERYNIGDVIRNYTSHMMYLLRHDKECVRQLALNEVYKTVASDISLLPTEKYVDVFVAVAHLVTDTDISIANKAILITSNLSFDAYPRVLEEMKIALEYTSRTKCNAFEVIVKISAKSPELLKLCAENGYIDFMIAELHSTDVLYQMNILELLSWLVIKPHGIRHLAQCGALKTISELIAGLENNPVGGLLVSAYMKFLGCIARFYPREIFQNYPTMLNLLFHALQSDDQIVLIIALDTLGFIGGTIEGKLSLVALGSQYTSAVTYVGTLIKTGPTEVKVRAIHCLSSLIGHDRDVSEGEVDHRVILMSREWFRSLSSQPSSMEVVHDICKNPFPDIKLAAFNLLDATCQYRWGEELVAQSPGFIEFLLDRKIDYSKEIKELKYEIIKKLSRSASFDTDILSRLTKYVEEGPFYSESVLQVAMEDGD